MAATLQEQARALGDPTRHAIFRYVAERPGVGVAELTEHFGLHHNAIRQHLAKLTDAELLVEGRAPVVGRGRPRLAYRVHPAAESRWGPEGPYERLTVLLTEMLRTGDSAEVVGQRAGERAAGRDGDDSDDPLAVVADAMARQGFEPTIERDGDEAEIVLGRCSFATTALADPEIVCALHLGIARGVAAASGGRVVVDELIPRDPRVAQCRLRVHLAETDDS